MRPVGAYYSPSPLRPISGLGQEEQTEEAMAFCNRKLQKQSEENQTQNVMFLGIGALLGAVGMHFMMGKS